MEGKGVLFKVFSDIDVFDIEVDSRDPDEIIQVVKAIAPTFGGINLEDIKAPECFYIEETLKSMLDIPVFHDDQHGTAIISSAGLISSLEVVGKKIEDIRIAISGAGASAISCANLAVKLGMVDSRGVLHTGRSDLNKYKQRFAVDTDARTLADAVRGADVFYGLSVADVLKPEMVKTMAEKPIIFAMANPDPEIKYEVAKEARPDCIMATGRSDYPNQVNNVLGFPFIFRGALDVRASAINEEMKMAAAHALADLTKEDVPDSVLRAYGVNSLKLGTEYIIPKPLDPRVMLWVSPAVAKAAMETGVARKQIDIDEYREQLAFRQGQGQQEELKIIRAAFQVKNDDIADPILIGNPEVIQGQIAELGLNFNPEIVDPQNIERVDDYARVYHEIRQRKGVNLRRSYRLIRDPQILGPLMLKVGLGWYTIILK